MRPFLDQSSLALPLGDFLAATTHAYTRDELVAQWSRHSLDRALAAGTAMRILPGIYCAPRCSSEPVVMGEAVNLWSPRSRITGAMALHLYAPRLPAPRGLDVITGNGDTLHPPAWIRVHQTGPVDATVSARGVDCVPMPRALLDAWRYARPAGRRDLLWEALWARVCTWRQLARELERAPRVAGRRELERMLGWFAEGATTPLEVRAKHEVFIGPSFRDVEWQAPLELPTRRAVPDMLHRPARVAVELEGDRYHSTREARDRDRERRNDLVAAGYAVVEFGWRDIADRPAWCRDRLLTVVADRLERVGSR